MVSFGRAATLPAVRADQFHTQPRIPVYSGYCSPLAPTISAPGTRHGPRASPESYLIHGRLRKLVCTKWNIWNRATKPLENDPLATFGSDAFRRHAHYHS